MGKNTGSWWPQSVILPANESRPFKTCQWPFGDPQTPEFHFCGEKAHEGFSYCLKHWKIAYRSAVPWEEAIERTNAR